MSQNNMSDLPEMVTEIRLSPDFRIYPPEGMFAWQTNRVIKDREVLGRCECGGHFILVFHLSNTTVVRCAGDNCKSWVCYPGLISTVHALTKAGRKECRRAEILNELNGLSLAELRCLVGHLRELAASRDFCPS